MESKLTWMATALLILISVAIGLFAGHRWGKRSVIPPASAPDTVTIYKTRAGLDAYVKKIEFDHWDLTIPSLSFTDTVYTEPIVKIVKDTVRVYVPISNQYFELDEGRVRLWTSGYKVNINSWEVDERTNFVNPPFKHHHIWIGADGYINNNPRLVISANYGYTTKWGLTLSGGVGYEPLSKQFEARVGLNWGLGF